MMMTIVNDFNDLLSYFILLGGLMELVMNSEILHISKGDPEMF